MVCAEAGARAHSSPHVRDVAWPPERSPAIRHNPTQPLPTLAVTSHPEPSPAIPSRPRPRRDRVCRDRTYNLFTNRHRPLCAA